MTVLAAGAVMWRRQPHGLEVLLVERTKHRDMSIPKGKLDPGETLPECAVREMLEETGIAIDLGAHLGVTRYTLPEGRPKAVHYWQAEVSSKAVKKSSFEPNSEISALHWMPLEQAKEECTYIHDVHLLELFQARAEASELSTIAIVALRHGKAEQPDFETPDAARKLTDRGRRQSRSIAPGIAAFGIDRVFTSTADRCVETVAPLAKRLGSETRQTRLLSQEPDREKTEKLQQKISRAVEKGRSTVFCSHAPVLPAVVAAVVGETAAEVTAGIRRSASLSTAAFSVYHVTTGENPRLISYETHQAPQ